MSETDTMPLFDSLTKPVPPFRAGIDIFPVESDGKKLIYIHDTLGYVPRPFVLNKEVAGLMALIDGEKSVTQIHQEIVNYQPETDVTEELLIKFIQHLDKNRVLFSDYFKQYAEEIESAFEAESVRPPTNSGTSYPEDPTELRSKLDEALGMGKVSENATRSRVLYAPHIDPRIGLSTYGKAFAPLQTVQPKRLIVLATSHYAGSYHPEYENTPFIISDKTYETPLGKVEPDKERLKQLSNSADHYGINTKDRAHRVEHSIELHLIFAQHIWPENFTMTPILVGPFEELFYSQDSHLEKKVDAMSGWLNEQIEDPDTFLLISGDLAHIGKKFGDSAAAQTMFEDVKAFDTTFLNYAKAGDSQALYRHISDDYDPYRICGFPPLYTFLKQAPNLEGEITGYQIWDENERESAVTFGSILYSEHESG